MTVSIDQLHPLPGGSSTTLIRAARPWHHHRAKIQVKSVDTVENPGHKHAASVDNPPSAIVDSWSPLLESGALSCNRFPLLFLEKLLVSVLTVAHLPQYGISPDNGYPQSCQPFGEACSTRCPEASPSDKLPTGLTASESQNCPRKPPKLRVRCVFDGFHGKVVHSCGKDCG